MKVHQSITEKLKKEEEDRIEAEKVRKEKEEEERLAKEEADKIQAEKDEEEKKEKDRIKAEEEEELMKKKQEEELANEMGNLEEKPIDDEGVKEGEMEME